MFDDKSIIIGCDDTAVLSNIQFVIDDIKSYNLNTISITNGSNLFSIVKSMEPDIVILCYRNNYKLLPELAALSKEKKIPILCYNKYVDSKSLTEFSNGIIFSYEYEHINKQGYVKSGIKSVLRLAERDSPSINVIEDSNQIRAKNSSRYVLEIDQKNEMLSKVKHRIKTLYSNVNELVRHELNSIVNSIDAAALGKNVWEDFKLYFEEVNPGFLSKLSHKHPELTPIDLKYCCYLKMNMSNNDIRHLLGINQESVRTHKYRLKKKMILPKESDLHRYVMSLAQ